MIYSRILETGFSAAVCILYYLFIHNAKPSSCYSRRQNRCTALGNLLSSKLKVSLVVLCWI